MNVSGAHLLDLDGVNNRSVFEIGVQPHINKYDNIPSVIDTLFAVFFAIGFISNTVLLLYFKLSKKHNVPIFAFLASLAASDWLVCALACMSVFRDAHIFCSVHMYINSVGYQASVYHIVMLSALRFYQLTQPLTAKSRVTVSLVRKCCLVMWLIAMCVPIGYGYFYRAVLIRTETGEKIVCSFVGNEEVYTLTNMMFALLPMTFIAILHIAKQCIVATQQSELTNQSRRSTSTNIVIAIIAIFIVSTFPYSVISIIHSFVNLPFHSFHIIVMYVSLESMLAVSVLNPFVYLLCSKEIRNDMLKVFSEKLFGNVKTA